MKINILKLIPNDWTVENVNKNHVRVSYKTIGRGNSPKPFILPNEIKIDKEFTEACAMYIGDGKLSKDLHHLDFTSKDKDMIKFMLNFFVKRLNLKKENIRFRLVYRQLKEDNIKDWTKYLNINKEDIHLQQSNRHKEECLGIQIGGIILRIIFEKIIQKILSYDFHKDKILRKAFLRGLFASEGGIGINDKENYIVYMAYHLSIFEKELSKLIYKLLNFEEIISKIIIRKEKGERYIQITGWDNYWKIFSKGLLNLNERKKNRFLNKIKTTNFQCYLEDNLISKLLNSKKISYRQLGIRNNISPVVISRLGLGKKKQLEFSRLLRLAEFCDINNQEIKRGIKNVSIKGTTLIEDRNIIDFLLMYKN